ncbi:BBF_HP2_G0025790.mRNA.1.CDS.1 [Saccharomyces cerevisiae]|nr:BBF_HP2_G0025790.mRNA.1.CDS.1 [Saccharomyces cerevisiae]CAI6577554.1 BBF_HP2_G0025790.mRNA.1.CDS.1 [Saccharomyces cerevisiae]CAI7142596.1 BBF_collapsed_G0023410.mRNA.1.CDS.1 [Saccharomyces cerevisiae]
MSLRPCLTPSSMQYSDIYIHPHTHHTHTTPTHHTHTPHTHTLSYIYLYSRCHSLPGFLTEIKKKNENEILFFSPTALLHSPK